MTAKRNRTTIRQLTADLPVPPHDAAARRRISQRRRQRITRHMRRFEALLPDAPVHQGIQLPSLSGGPLLGWLRSRPFWFAVLAGVVCMAVVTWVHSDEHWFIYREDAYFRGLTYLDADELWTLSKMDGWNVFWLDTEAARARLLEDPYVADVKLSVSPLTASVTVDVSEVRPVALWITEQGKFWLLEDGRALPPRGATPPDLLEIVDQPADATRPGAPRGTAIDPDVLASAEGIARLLPEAAPVRYNQNIGLNFRLPNGTYWVYWGDGSGVEQKLENLAAAERLIAAGDVEGTIVDVRYDRPYVR